MIKNKFFLALNLCILCQQTSAAETPQPNETTRIMGQVKRYNLLKEKPWGLSTEDWKKKQRAAALAEKEKPGALPSQAERAQPDNKKLGQAITQCEAILATEAISVLQDASITGAMFSIITKIDLGSIDSFQQFERLFSQITNFTWQLQRRIANLANTQSITGGALASIVAARQKLGITQEKDWSIFINTIMPLITQEPFNPISPAETIISNLTQRVDELSNALKELQMSSGLLTQDAKNSILSMLGAYQITLATLVLTLESASTKLPQSEEASTIAQMGTWVAKFAAGQGVSYLLKRATSGIINFDLSPDFFGFTEQVLLASQQGAAETYIANAWAQHHNTLITMIPLTTAVEATVSSALQMATNVPLEAARAKAQYTMQASLLGTKEMLATEKQKIEEQKSALTILDNETILSKMYAEITKTIAEDIVHKLRMHMEDPDYGYELGSPKCTYEFQTLFNSLITLSNHIAEFAHANSAAGIALLNIMKEREGAGHNNQERFKIFIQTIVPLFKQLPEPLGSPIEYATMIRFKNYEEQLARAEAFFVFTPTERASGTLLENDILSKEAVNRLTTVIRSYRAAIFALMRTFDQIKESLPGPRGAWWRAVQYVTGSRLFSVGKSVTLTFGYTLAAASMATPAGWGFFFLTLAIPFVGDYALGLAGSGAKKLVSPRAETQGNVAAKIMEKEKAQEEARMKRREELKSIPAFREKFEREEQLKGTPALVPAQP